MKALLYSRKQLHLGAFLRVVLAVSWLLGQVLTATMTANALQGEPEQTASVSSEVAPAPSPQRLNSPGVSVSLDMPSTVFIGEDFEFTATFDNNGSDPGYGPFIDLVFPVTGADGDDGIDFTSATYLGASVESVVQTFPDDGDGTGCVEHPWVKDSNGDYVEVCGPAGDKLVSLKLPFGSFVPDQPPADITIKAHLSDKADLGTPLHIRYRGGYMYGEDPLDNWCCGDTPIAQPGDPDSSNWPSDSVDPIVMTMSKSYNGPSNTSAETATGPNYPRSYTIAVDIATGQKVASLHVVDTLPDDVQFLSYEVQDASGNALASTANSTPSTTTPGGTLDITLNSAVTGADGDDVFVTIEYYVPYKDANNDLVIAADTGAAVNSTNSATVSGDWTPIDTRDTPAPVSVTAEGVPGEVTVTHRSLAIQKSVSNKTDNQNSPGDVLEYTLNFQVSDFFAFDQIVVTDTISDGQHFDSSFAPTLEINGNTYTLSAANFNSANYDVLCNYNGGPGPECTSADSTVDAGKTKIVFRVSDEIVSRGQSNGRLVGGCINPAGGSNPPSCNAYNDGATEGTIVFRTVIQEKFTDNYPSGDDSVDQGDALDDTVEVQGRNLDTGNFQPTGSSVTDDATASISIGRADLTKAIYAINDETDSTQWATDGNGNVVIKPGDKITYRLKYDLPTSDVEELSFDDFLPLPVFDVDDPDDDGNNGPSWSFSSAGGIPAPGVVTLGPSDTFYQYMTDGLNNGTGTLSASTHNTTPTQDPVVVSDSDANKIAIYYADYDDTRDQTTTVDLLFSVVVSAEPFADGLMLTNEAHAYEGSTNASDSTANAIVQVKLTEPVLVGQKGVVWTNNANASLDAEAGGGVTWLDSSNAPRWSGTISASSLDAHPIDANISGVDAGDIVTFAITIRNTGSSLKGAFDITLKDIMDSDYYQIPSGGINLQIYYGDGGTNIPYKAVDGSCTVDPAADGDSCGEEIFQEGIELIDPSEKGVCQAHDPNLNNDVIIITYDLEVKPDVHPGEALNTLHVMSYAGVEGGPDFLDDNGGDLTDDASGTVNAGFEKALDNTEIFTADNTNDEVAIGELVTYKLTATIPEGEIPNAQMTDHLDGGLAFVDCVSVVPSSTDVTTDLASGNDFSGVCANDVTVTNDGQDITFNLGNITNANRDNTTTETLTITYRAVVLDVSGNQAGTLLNNAAEFLMDEDGAGGNDPVSLGTDNAEDVTVVEPTLHLSKSASTANADAGDTITYTLVVSNDSTVDDTTAYDVHLSDVIPEGLTYINGSFQSEPGNCDALPDSVSDTGGNLEATWDDIGPNGSCTLTFQAKVDYTASPGQSIVNQANMTWTSLPGDQTTARSTYNSASTERTGDDGVGGLDDYATTAEATVTVNNTVPKKYLMTTSESHTDDSDVAIGEIVRYRLVVSVPEGTSNNFQLVDALPPGLTFLNDGTAKVGFVTDGSGITSTGTGVVPALSGCTITGNTADNTTPASSDLPCVLADGNIADTADVNTNSDAYSSGTDVYFRLGDLVNNDSDDDTEYVVLEFNALVDNSSTANNTAGDTLTNNFTVWIDGSQNGNASNDVTVTVVEPHITVDKNVVTAATDAGDAMVYRISITNDASGAGAAAAFDLSLTDTLSSYLNLNSVTIYTDGTNGSTTLAGSCGDTTQTVTNNSGTGTGATVKVDITCLNPGEKVVVDIDATVVDDVPAGVTIANTANGEGSSLPGTGTSNGSGGNDTGSTTPGASGTATGERTYSDSSTASTALAKPTIDKTVSPSQFTIGDEIVFYLLVTLPEGVTKDLQVYDNFPVGLEYVDHQVLTEADTSPRLSEDFKGTFANDPPNVTVTGGSGGDLTLDFGDTTVDADNNANNNSFVVRIVARVMDVTDNQDGDSKTNTGEVRWTNPDTNATDSASDTASISIIEPRIETTKSVSPTSDVVAGDTLSYTVKFENTGNSTAYDVTADDTLPDGVTYDANSAACQDDGGNTVGVTVTVSGQDLHFDGDPAGSWDIPVNGYIQCTYTATAQNSLYLDGDHTNTIDADWSSQDGTPSGSKVERVYDDTTTYEVDGTQDTASATFSSPAPTFDKSDNATQAVIGQTYHVTLTLSSSSGTLRDLKVTDVLPAGLVYVDNSQTVSSGISPTPTFTVSTPNDGSSSVTLTWDFGGDAVVSADTVTFEYDVLVANVSGNQNGTALTNQATLAYTDAGGTDKTLTDTDDVTVIEPELGIQKSVDDDTPAYGQTVTYTLTLSHQSTSTADAYDVVVTDTLPSGLTYVDSSATAPTGWTVSYNSATKKLTWTGDLSQATGSVSMTYQATVDGPPPPPNVGDTLTNDVETTWTSLSGDNDNERTGEDGTSGLNDYAASTSASATVTNPDLTITKDDGATTYVPGESVTYTITVKNVGNGDVTGATVSDAIPTQVTSWSWICTMSGGANGCDGVTDSTTDFSDTVDLPAGASITYTVTAQIASSATGDMSNTAEAGMPSGVSDPTPDNNSATDTDTADPQADLSVTKDDGVAAYVPGESVTYTIVVKNDGPSDALGALVSDDKPSQVSSWTWECTGATGGASGCDGVTNSTGNFTDTVNLPAGASITYTVTAQIASSATGDLTNTVTVTAPSGVTDPNTDNNTATDTDTVDAQSAISVTKDDGVAAYVPGESVTYTIVVKNDGPSDALGVSVSDAKPSQVTSWTWECTGTTGGASGCDGVTDSTADFSDTVDLPAGASITYTVTAQIASSATGDLSNTASVSHANDTTPDDNSATDTDTQNSQADLYVTKTDNSATYTPGTTVTYTVVVGNDGPSDALGVSFNDAIPSQATSWTWECTSTAGGASGCDGVTDSTADFSDTVDLPAGSSITYTVTMTVPASATGDLTNTAEVVAPSGVTDPNTDNNTATDTDTQHSLVDLSVTKDDGVAEYTPGTSVTYTITVSNAGPSDALGVAVSDAKPSQVTSWTWECTGATGGADGCDGVTDSTTDFSDTVDLPAGASITYTVTAQIASSATGDLANTVTVTPPAGVEESDDTNNTATDTDTSDPQADLSSTKDDGIMAVSPGQTVTYTITVSNAGPSDAVGAIVSDAKPSQVVLWTWECTGATGGASGCDGVTDSTADFSDTVNLPTGASITYTVTAQIAADAVSGKLSNIVDIQPPSGVADPAPDNNQAEDEDALLTNDSDTSKTFTDSNQTFTTDPEVAIGEILTYEVVLRVPAESQMAGVTLTDILDRGLAFLECESVDLGGVTSSAGDEAALCNDPANPVVSVYPAGSTAPEDQGRQVVWNFGDLTNSANTDAVVTVRYRVVVLDNEDNQSGVSLHNQAVWRWTGGEVTGSAAPVTIREPDLDIAKSADPRIVLPDEPITFTLRISHTANSETNAYDVVVRDLLPPTLHYVDASLTAASGPTPTSMAYDPVTRTITVTWDTFSLGSTATITFQATLDTTPGNAAVNEASVAWSSLPGDVSAPQSPYNVLSTERFYDPASPIDVYGKVSVIDVRMALPDTGFAPGRVTAVPQQTIRYDALDGIVLEIPKLGVKVPVVGVPRTEKGWDLTWLWDNAGWLEGTAFPTWAGNTAITAHVYLPDGEPGPFVNLYDLRWGDQVIIHADGKRYVYEVRDVGLVEPDDASVLRHKERDWVTLITCKGYDEAANTYAYRVVVQAVLVQVEPER